jgi:hypothetical protein
LKQAGWKLEGRNLYIKGIGRFKLFLSCPIEGDIKTVTIIRRPTGKWFVSFSVMVYRKRNSLLQAKILV